MQDDFVAVTISCFITEQHHFAVTCRILTNKERNIFRNVANRDDILSDTRSLILATDLALHREIMDDFTKRIKKFNFSNRCGFKVLTIYETFCTIKLPGWA